MNSFVHTRGVFVYERRRSKCKFNDRSGLKIRESKIVRRFIFNLTTSEFRKHDTKIVTTCLQRTLINKVRRGGEPRTRSIIIGLRNFVKIRVFINKAQELKPR